MSFGKVKNSDAARKRKAKQRSKQDKADRALIQPSEAIERIEARFGPGSAPRALPRHVRPYAAYLRLKQNDEPTVREIVKAYAVTRSSIQRGALPKQTVCRSYPEYKPLKRMIQRENLRPEDVFATLLFSPLGQQYLDAAERGTFDEKAAKEITRRTTCFGFPNTLFNDMRYAVDLGRRAPELREALRAKPEAWIRYVQDHVSGVSAAKAGFLASMLGRGDVATFDARERKLWAKSPPLTTNEEKRAYGCETRLLQKTETLTDGTTRVVEKEVFTGKRRGKVNPRCKMPEAGYEDVNAYRKRIRAYPLELAAEDERNREHLVHHAIWDAYPDEGKVVDPVTGKEKPAKQSKTTHGAVIRAMQFAGRSRKPRR